MPKFLVIFLVILGLAIPVQAGEIVGHPEPDAPTSAVYLPIIFCDGPSVFGRPACNQVVIVTATPTLVETARLQRLARQP